MVGGDYLPPHHHKRMETLVIEYILCYAGSFFLGMGTAFLMMYVTIRILHARACRR